MAADTAHTNDATAKALNMLKRIRRLEGTALISGGVLLHDDCPRGTDARLFSQTIVQLFDELEANNDFADDVLISFDGGELLLMFRYPVILCLFYNRDEDVSSVEKGGNQFLNQFSSALGIQSERPNKSATNGNIARTIPQTTSEPKFVEEEPIASEPSMSDQDAWIEFRRRIEILLTKVLGSAQASRNISRELSAMGVSGNSAYLKKAQFRPFGQKLTSRIKDKQIRRQLEDEMVSIIDSLL